MGSAPDERFIRDQGVSVSVRRPLHRQDHYEEEWLDVVRDIQGRHFWYRGRHKLLHRILRQEVARRFSARDDLRAIDLGGGCGGWIEYLRDHSPEMFAERALADSSRRALALADQVVGSFADRYQIDLLDLDWNEEWDVAFLLDVIEHIPDHEEVLRQVRRSLRPGGLLFVTAPALMFFWSYNDVVGHHQRRYSKRDFRELAARLDLELVRTDYFMFLMSPALLLGRLLFKPPRDATSEQILRHLTKAHKTPCRPLNAFLTGLMSIETALIDTVRFPWGTSALAVFRRP